MPKPTIPCIDCVLYAICRAQLLSHPKSPWSSLKEDIICKCSLLYDYICKGSERHLPRSRDHKDNPLMNTILTYSKPAGRLQEIETYICEGILPEPKKRKPRHRRAFLNPDIQAD